MDIETTAVIFYTNRFDKLSINWPIKGQNLLESSIFRDIFTALKINPEYEEFYVKFQITDTIVFLIEYKSTKRPTDALNIHMHILDIGLCEIIIRITPKLIDISTTVYSNDACRTWCIIYPGFPNLTIFNRYNETETICELPITYILKFIMFAKMIISISDL
jgi:hypothetical protein